MVIRVRDEATEAAIAQLAILKGKSREEAVREAVENELRLTEQALRTQSKSRRPEGGDAQSA